MRLLVHAIAPYAATALASLAILSVLTELWRLDLSVPLLYRQDALVGQVWTKSIMEEGWYLKNPRLGAPLRSEMHDFPQADNLHFGILKLAGWALPNWPVAFNAYFLLTFPLIALSSLFALRQFGVTWGPASVASILFTFLPYHWLRGEGHLFLAAYYLVPLSILVAMWIYLGQLSGTPPRAFPTEYENGRRKLCLSVIVCGLQSSAGIYYAFFTSFLFVIATLAACWRRRTLRPCLATGLLLATTVAGIVANTAPSLIYWHRHGTNPEVAVRSPVETEMFSLKLAPLLLPVQRHVLPSLASLRARYDESSTFLNETASGTLGTVGGIGFLALLAWTLFIRGHTRHPLVEGLATMNLALVLLATTGGFGMLFSLLVSPQIRAYNRASVFIAFFALSAVALALTRLEGRCSSRLHRRAYGCLLGVVLIGGVIDQSAFDLLPVPRWEVPDRAALKKQFYADAEFAGRMEARLPPGAAVYQLPYSSFPEAPLVCQMDAYEHFRPYLHSKTLRFSHGGMRGRPADRWHRAIQLLPIDKFLEAIINADFSAIYIDRKGYPDRGRQWEAELQERLGTAPLVSGDDEHSFFLLSPLRERLRFAAGPR